VLALVALIASLLDPNFDAAGHGARLLLIAFTIYAAGLLLANPLSSRLQHGVAAGDIVASSILMYFTEGAASPFFPFFLFINVAAALRGGWRAALVTAGVLTFVLFALFLITPHPVSGPETGHADFDLSRVLFRSGFLLATGALLAYLGAVLQQTRTWFAQFAAWPTNPSESGREPLAVSLKHAAGVMGARRILVIWEQPEQPFRFVNLWSDENMQKSREQAATFGKLVSPEHVDGTFIADGRHSAGGTPSLSLLDRELRRVFNIQSALTAPFRRPKCAGRVFILDGDWSSNHLAPAEIIAARIGMEIEGSLLISELEHAAAERERTQVARDLHDGVLQGLTAASIKLKLAAADMSQEARDQLNSVRNMLTTEAQRIRLFVEESRNVPPGSGPVPLAPQLQKRIASLRDQWPCEIAINVPADITCSFSIGRNIRKIITEAVSNAVRHGAATRLQITVARSNDRLVVDIHDNGRGFAGLVGSYRDTELAEKNIGPLSLRGRVSDLAGSLILISSPQGTQIKIEVPA